MPGLVRPEGYLWQVSRLIPRPFTMANVNQTHDRWLSPEQRVGQLGLPTEQFGLPTE